MKAFSAMESRGSLDVLIERGDTFSLTVSIDSNLLDAVKTDVVNGVAAISTCTEDASASAQRPFCSETLRFCHPMSQNTAGGFFRGTHASEDT